MRKEAVIISASLLAAIGSVCGGETSPTPDSSKENELKTRIAGLEATVKVLIPTPTEVGASQRPTIVPIETVFPTLTVEPTPTATIAKPKPTDTSIPALFPTATETTAVLTPTPEVKQNSSIFFKGLDTMKLTKDTQRNPVSIENKNKIAKLAKELGVTHLTVDTPYDNASGTDVIKDTREWVKAIREAGLSVSHRHMLMGFEGIYDQQRNSGIDFTAEMRQWMIDNADLIQEGDTWTPMPEPQNGGVVGINCNPNAQACIFKDVNEFNKFIQDVVTTSRKTLQELGKNNVKVICCGFDLFVVSGNNNPDWEGKSFLQPETVNVLKPEGIAVDHYPQPDYKTGERRTYGEDLDQAEKTWPGVPIILTEVGKPDVNDAESVESMFSAFRQHAEDGPLEGVFWWPFGPSGLEESLLNPDFTPKPIYWEVQKGFASLPASVSKK